MIKKLFITLLFASIGLVAISQSNTANPPVLLVEKLKIFEPYFGKYQHTMDYAGTKWKGTMEVNPIIKGWYVDWTIYTRSEDNKFDREYHMLVTYDTVKNKYRVWRFETTPPAEAEPTLRTEGTDIIVEMNLTRNGSVVNFYNRYILDGKDGVKIITESRTPEGQKIRDIGVTLGRRIK